MEIETIAPFLQYFSGVRERTMRVARLSPPDKMDWSCAEGKFTLGDLLRHVAVTERYMWGETVQGKQSRYVSHGKELAKAMARSFHSWRSFTSNLCRSSRDYPTLISNESVGHPQEPRSELPSGFERWWNMRFITAVRFIYI